MSKISIIIAAYNVENFIEETIQSARNQTLEDIEIIVVDDCSTDSTSSIISKMASEDSRIKIVRHDVNKSSLIARKSGVAAASGEYIQFLDGDDLLEPDACAVAYEAAVQRDVDILHFDAVVFDESGVLTEDNPEAVGIFDYLKHPECRLTVRGDGELLSLEQEVGRFNFTLWNKIFRASYAKEALSLIPDTYSNMAEDILMSYLLFYFARSYDTIENKLYLYRFGVGITGSGLLSDAKAEAMAKSWYIYKFLDKFTEERGKKELCSAVLSRIREQMLLNVADTIFFKANERQYNSFIESVRAYGCEEDVILAIAYYTYVKRVVREDRAADICSKVSMFSSPKKSEAKVIGTFYYRMYNGGVENALSIITDMWVKSGYEVVLFTDCEPNELDYPINEKIRRVSLPPVIEPTVDCIEKRVSAFRRALIEEKVDLMVYNAWINPYLVLDEMTVRSAGIKLLIHTHGMFCCDMLSPDTSAAYRNLNLGNLYSLSDMVIALNDVDVAWWKNYGLRAEKTVNPIKLSADIAPAALGGHNIVCTGRIDYNKQPIHAIKIAEEVKKKIPDVTLTWVGGTDDTEYEKQVLAYIEEHSLADTVKMVGFTHDVLPYYQGADIMLSTSRYEGFSLALTESKLCGLPLVCYYLSNWDMARTPKGMINVPQGDIAAAADAIVKILQDDELKHRMGKEARESAEELYSIDLAAHWQHIFDETLKEKEPSCEVKPPMEQALHSMVAFLSEGMLSRVGGTYVAPPMQYIEHLHGMIESLKNSESYRLGLFLTAIPRKIKRMFTRKKK